MDKPSQRITFMTVRWFAAGVVALLAVGCGSSSLQSGATGTGGTGDTGTLATGGTGGTAGGAVDGGSTDGGNRCYDLAASTASGTPTYVACDGAPDGGDLCIDRMASAFPGNHTVYSRCCPVNPDCQAEPDGYPGYPCVSRESGWCWCSCQGGVWSCGC